MISIIRYNLSQLLQNKYKENSRHVIRTILRTNYELSPLSEALDSNESNPCPIVYEFICGMYLDT